MKRTDRAVEDFLAGYSCAQAVFMAFAEENGMSRDDAARVATAFGGGISHMRLTCGAVTGALMAIGLGSGGGPETKPAVYARAQELMKRFSREHGSINCLELIGYDLDNPDHVAEAREEGVFQTRCSGFVRSAVMFIEEMSEG